MAQPVDKVAKPKDTSQPILSRAQLQEIEEDPSKLETVARLMGAVNLDNLFRFMQRPDVPANARLEFQKMLNRMGRLEPEKVEESAGGGPQVIINITRAKDADQGVTIEGTSRAVGDDT